MRKTIDIDLLNKLGNPRKLAERNLEHLMERAETPLGIAANGLTAKVLSLFVPREGTSISMNESTILQELTQNENHSVAEIRSVLRSLEDSNILLATKDGQLKMASNVLANQIYNKIEAENLVLRKVENFINDRYSIYQEKNHLLNQEDLNYISHYLPSISISEEENIFIRKSRKEIRRKRQRGFLIAALVISALTILSSIALIQYFKANRSLKVATEQKKLAEIAEQKAVTLADKNKKLAETNRLEADKNKELANKNEQLAIAAQEEATANARLAAENRKLATAAEAEADRNKELANKNEQLAKQERKRAEENEKLAKENEKLAAEETKRAEENNKLAEKNDEMRKIAFSQKLAKQSIQMDIEESEVKALLAREAFETNLKSKEGNIYQPDIYGALYDGLKTLNEVSGNGGFNEKTNEPGSIRSIVFSNDKPGDTFFTISSSGHLKMWKVNRWDDINVPDVDVTILVKLGDVQNMLKISDDNNWLAVAGELPHVILYNLKDLIKNGSNANVTTINAHDGQETLTLNFTPDSKNIITSGADNKLKRYNIKDKTISTLATTDAPIDAVAVSPLYPNDIHYGTSSGRFYELKIGSTPVELNIISSNERKRGISAIAISRYENRKVLVIGHKNGLVKRIQVKDEDLFSGNSLGYIPSKLHTARISDIKISPDGNYIGVASYDGSASLWYIDKMVNASYYQPMIFTGEKSWVTALSFTPRTAHIILGYRDGELVFFNPDPNVYAEAICNTLNRSMTHDEWKLYIGNALGFHYRESCN